MNPSGCGYGFSVPVDFMEDPLHLAVQHRVEQLARLIDLDHPAVLASRSQQGRVGESGESCRADTPVDREPVRRLEGEDRLLGQPPVRPVPRAHPETKSMQPLLQVGHGRALVAGLQNIGHGRRSGCRRGRRADGGRRRSLRRRACSRTSAALATPEPCAQHEVAQDDAISTSAGMSLSAEGRARPAGASWTMSAWRARPRAPL